MREEFEFVGGGGGGCVATRPRILVSNLSPLDFTLLDMVIYASNINNSIYS